jgi:uncharacterized protein Yka (UPF0111/DUF47 family)
MANQKQICLADETGEMRWFQQDALEQQLAGADMSASGALKSLIRNFSKSVREMREAQTAYFGANYGSAEKERHLRRAKELEKKVDDMGKNIHRTLELLG